MRTASPAAAPAEMNSRRSASLCSSAMLASRSCASPDASAASMPCSPSPAHVPHEQPQAKGISSITGHICAAACWLCQASFASPATSSRATQACPAHAPCKPASARQLNVHVPPGEVAGCHKQGITEDYRRGQHLFLPLTQVHARRSPLHTRRHARHHCCASRPPSHDRRSCCHSCAARAAAAAAAGAAALGARTTAASSTSRTALHNVARLTSARHGSGE